MKSDTDRLASGQFRHHFVKLTILSAMAISIMLSLSGCNTMQGLGKDVEKAGEAIQKSTK